MSRPVLDVDTGPLVFSAGPTADTRRLRVDGAISDIVLHRAALPPCTAPADTPENNFDIFWQTYRENYPFFALHGVDWDRTRAEYRPKITSATTPEQLAAILQSMIEPLH
ncbi:MAG: S41 family peptidase, partial [Steroidobacteraceae bacterium]